jgi:hypothetical protein
LPWVRANPHFEEVDFRAEAEKRAGRGLASGEVSNFWFAEAWSHMRQQPGFAIEVFLRKAALFWNHFEVSDNQDQYTLESACWTLRLPLLGFGAVAPLALLGAIATFRRRREVRLLCGFVLVYAASVVAFFIFSRYRIQVIPALLPLAAIGVAEIAVAIRGRRWQRLATGGVLWAGATWFCLHTIGIFAVDNELVADLRQQHMAELYLVAGDRDRAIDILRQAVERCPLHCPNTLVMLMDGYRQAKRDAEAEALLRRLTESHPDHREAWLQLAGLLRVSGREQEALECERRGTR